MPTGVFADEARTLEEDEDGGFYLTMPTTGTDTLDLSDKPVGFSFTVYDDGGAYNNYSTDSDCYLEITAPAGMTLTVSGVGAGGDTLNYDWLTFLPCSATKNTADRAITRSKNCKRPAAY